MPHICGEKASAEIKDGLLVESPPHARGKEGTALSHCGILRITPACAGKRRR